MTAIGWIVLLLGVCIVWGVVIGIVVLLLDEL